MLNIFISIYNDIYDITQYISKHPGEGIRSIYLKQYNRKEATIEYNQFHMTDEPDELLYKAKNNTLDKKYGIKYICPFFFKRKIPKYFIYIEEDPYLVEYIKNKDKNSFVLRKSNSDPNNSVSVTYKDNNNIIQHLKISKMEKGWYTIWKNENSETVEITKKYIEEIIKELFENNSYIGIW